VDLPLDVQNAEIDFDPQLTSHSHLTIPNHYRRYRKGIQMINEAKNPVKIMGGGVILAKATDMCVQLPR
jgi:tartronate-semialdehyde synthase